MAKTKKIKLNIFSMLILSTAVFGLLFFNFKNTKAEIFDCDAYLKNSLAANTSCDQFTGTEKKKCIEHDRKIKIDCQMVEIKSMQGSTLQKQLLTIDIEQQRNQIELKKTQAQAEDLSQQIADLEEEITYKENLIKYQQLILAGLMQTYYEYDQEGVLELVLANKNFSDVLNQGDYIEQSSDKVSEVLKTIQKEKAELQEKYNVLKDKKEESERVKKELEDKKANLQYTENQKQSLLTQTQGEEAKYQTLLARVEQQKLELFNFGSAENLDDVINSVNDYPRPKDHLASTSWFFSQRDSRWGKKTIGNSSSLMEDYGCAVASLSMVFKFHGAGVNPGTMAKQKIFYYDLIKWPGSWSPDIDLISSISHGNINWKTIDSEIGKGHPVIVFIKKTNGRGGHYVVVHNKDSKDYIVHDPYFGSNLYLGTSKALVGKLGTNSGTKIDQMIVYE